LDSKVRVREHIVQHSLEMVGQSFCGNFFFGRGGHGKDLVDWEAKLFHGSQKSLVVGRHGGDGLAQNHVKRRPEVEEKHSCWEPSHRGPMLVELHNMVGYIGANSSSATALEMADSRLPRADEVASDRLVIQFRTVIRDEYAAVGMCQIWRCFPLPEGDQSTAFPM
jgi:hypothetical protein